MMASTCDGDNEWHGQHNGRVETAHNANASLQSGSHTYGNTTINTTDMVVMGNHIQHLCRVSQHNITANDEDRFIELRGSLSFNRIDFRVNNVKKALRYTCEWIIQHPNFRTWYEGGPSNDQNGFLWIKGKPGCGKSTIMKAALEWAYKQKAKDQTDHTIIPYFFNARATSYLEKSSLGLYRTVAYHLLWSCQPLKPLFMERFASKDPGPMGQNWTTEELQGFLVDMIESDKLSGLCLFIDALDEAAYEDDVRQMITFLIQFSDRAIASDDLPKLRICLSSRHYPHISVGRGLSLVVENQAQHRRDIELYIEKHLSCEDGPERDAFQDQILNKSAQVFLWVVLVVEILNKLDDHGASLSDMKARLEITPAGLDELFGEILTRNSDGIETTLLFFQWTLFSMRPMEPAEVYFAVQFSRSPDETTWFHPHESVKPPRERLARWIVSCSRGLAEIVDIATSPTPVVQFIHEAVRDFLQRENAFLSVFPTPNMSLAGVSHNLLRIACSRRVLATPVLFARGFGEGHDTFSSLTDFKSSTDRDFPFLNYAISYVFYHSEQAQKHDVSQQDFLQNQMDENGHWLNASRLWWNTLKLNENAMQTSVTLLYFVADQQLLSLLSMLLSIPTTTKEVCDQVCGKYGSALHVAAYRGSKEVTQMLVDKGVDIYLQGPYGSPLEIALTLGRMNITQSLLNGNDRTTPELQNYVDTLEVAIIFEQEEIVQKLLDKGTDIDLPNEWMDWALYKALAIGHETIVQILLDRRAKISQSRLDSHPCALSISSDEGITQMAPERDLNMHMQGGGTVSALQVASAMGYEGIVKMLLKRGADVNAPGHQGTAIYLASMNGRVKIMNILLEHGATADFDISEPMEPSPEPSPPLDKHGKQSLQDSR